MKWNHTRMGRGKGRQISTGSLFRMFYYKEQRNKAVTRGTYGSRKKVFPMWEGKYMFLCCTAGASRGKTWTTAGALSLSNEKEKG